MIVEQDLTLIIYEISNKNKIILLMFDIIVMDSTRMGQDNGG